MWEYVITVTPRQRDVAHCVRGRRRGKKRRMRRGLYARRGGVGGGRRRRGDTYVARARERVCVRLINQTFAFGCRGMRWRREGEEEPEEREAGGSGGQAGSSTRPSRAKQSQALSFSLSAPRWAKLQPLLPPPWLTLVVISLARYFCVALTRTPLRPSRSVYRSTESLSWCSFSVCLPACLCLSVGWVPLSLPQPLALTLARCLPPCPPTSHQPRLCIAGTGNQHTSRPIAGC